MLLESDEEVHSGQGDEVHTCKTEECHETVGVLKCSGVDSEHVVCPVWQVTGGFGVGGIIVRSAESLRSPVVGRLATNSLIRAWEHGCWRLRYELLHGDGPLCGWVSIRQNKKNLVVPVEHTELEGLAFQTYCEHLRVDFKGDLMPDEESLSTEAVITTENFVQTVLSTSGAQPSQSLQRQECKTAEDSDGEVLVFCCHCSLPLGDIAYGRGEESACFVHGECMAQLMYQDFVAMERVRRKTQEDVKRVCREKHSIGWRPSFVPSNVRSVVELANTSVLGTADYRGQGMCCLVLHSGSMRVSVAPTVDPASAVNLEYLSLALEVRLKEGREPMFSLDPVDGDSHTQVKRFEPYWLAGTSVGEVLFQADIYLKELSMGEYPQPVVGMKCCLDHESDVAGSWRAREWFVVRSAEIFLSEDGVLVPSCTMGVEARELKAHGREDARITRDDHPLVKYAADFSHNFDLIAERRSAVFQLREVAKASILAKFLLEGNFFLEDSWFRLWSRPDADVARQLSLEIPQLWNERLESKIQLQNGQLVDAERGVASNVRSVYGGVQFGLDRFSLCVTRQSRHPLLSPPQYAKTVPSLEPLRGMAETLSATPGPSRLSPSSAVDVNPVPSSVPSAPLVFRQEVAFRHRHLQRPLVSSTFVPGEAPSPRVIQAPRAATAIDGIREQRLPVKRLRGVDLSLDTFTEIISSCSGAVRAWADVNFAGAFWSELDTSMGLLHPDAQRLLRSVFNEHLSDRRGEGSCFTPPNTSPGYIEALHGLLLREAEVRSKRVAHFFSADFAEEDPGPLFPSSWKGSMEIVGRHVENLRVRRSFSQADIQALLVSSKVVPVFRNIAEDGMHFHIYSCGAWEVRTIQWKSKVVASVFSSDANSSPSALGTPCDADKVVKVTTYVEMDRETTSHRFFVVLETAHGHLVVTEQQQDGQSTWDERCEALDARCAFAKTLYFADCTGTGVRVRDVLAWRVRFGCRYACSTGRRYAKLIHARAAGADIVPRRTKKRAEPRSAPTFIPGGQLPSELTGISLADFSSPNISSEQLAVYSLAGRRGENESQRRLSPKFVVMSFDKLAKGTREVLASSSRQQTVGNWHTC